MPWSLNLKKKKFIYAMHIFTQSDILHTTRRVLSPSLVSSTVETSLKCQERIRTRARF